jgi:hypothetical protein
VGKAHLCLTLNTLGNCKCERLANYLLDCCLVMLEAYSLSSPAVAAKITSEINKSHELHNIQNTKKKMPCDILLYSEQESK